MQNRHLTETFSRLKALLKQYEGPLTPKLDFENKYDLWSEKEVVVDGRTRSAVFFAGIMIHGDHVALHYMPVYLDEQLASVFAPELLEMLHGKARFHFVELDDNLAQGVDEALRVGFELYQERGWV
jgi:hypothetical protein